MIEFFLWHGLMIVSVMTISFAAGFVSARLLSNKQKG